MRQHSGTVLVKRCPRLFFRHCPSSLLTLFPLMRLFFTRPVLLVATALSLLTNLVAQATTINVTVTDNRYSPSSVTAAPGDQIVFTYNGASSHPTASDNNAWPTFPLNSSAHTGTVTLNTPGTYPYHCQFHGGAGGIGMAGTITIQALGLPGDAPYAAALAAFPNPASAARDGSVTITLNQKANTEGAVRLLNVIGRVVREVPLRRNESGEVRIAMDVENLPAGVYFYALVLGDRVVETRRLVVQP